MNIFIMLSGDRQLLANLIYHHNYIGNTVFIEHPNKHMNISWPSLLTYSTQNDQKINFHLYGLDDQSKHLGEDFFLELEEIQSSLADKNITCSFIDPMIDDIKIDIVHLLRGIDKSQKELAKQICKKHNAKLISSEMSPYTDKEEHKHITNALVTMPSTCESVNYKHKFIIYPTDYEFKILGVSPNNNLSRRGFASFNHNFQARHVDDYDFQQKINNLLPQELQIINYGGNTRGVGADIRDCSKNDQKYITISPREASKKFMSLQCVVLFKKNDWGGGVVWNSLVSKTPVVVRPEYYKKTNLCKYMQDKKHCIVVNSPEEASQELFNFSNDKFLFYHQNIKELFESLVNDEYWTNFKDFIDNAL